jgi:hypothetical protein
MSKAQLTLFAGATAVVGGALFFALAPNDASEVPAAPAPVAAQAPIAVAPAARAPASDPAVAAQLAALQQRIEQLEAEKAKAPQINVVVANGSGEAGSGEAGAGAEGAAEATAAEQFPEDGHVYDDGVVVDYNPTAPMAPDLFPAGADPTKQPAREEMPEDCPTCEPSD